MVPFPWIRKPQKPQESAVFCKNHSFAPLLQISFSHTRPDGRDFSTALSEAGASFRASGENIAYGQRSAEQVMDVWMNGAGHRANILNPGYSRIGIGHVKDSRGVDHWVQLFLN